MKKIYIEPSVKAVEIKLPAILAGSETVNGEKITNQNEIASFDADFSEFDEE